MSNDREAQRQALKEAARWHVQRMAGDASPGLERAWRAWLDSAPQNGWAWARVEQLHGQLASVPGGLAFDAFKRAEAQGLTRRGVVKGLLLATGLGLGGWASYRSTPAQALLADVHSGTGEIRSVTLADGSQLVLDTASAVNIRFDNRQRLIQLVRGRILLTSGKDVQQRPLRVQTAQGVVQALGTRFSVAQQAGRSEVEVFEHAVRVSPLLGEAQRLESGQACGFSDQRVDSPQLASAAQAAWSLGQLVVENWRLGDLLDELGRYRPGLLTYAPQLAEQRVSGNFSLTDSDAALSALARSFDLRIERHGRYWVRVM